MNSELRQQEPDRWLLAHLYSPRLQDRLGTDKVTTDVSGAGWRESRADELVWAGLMTGLRGPVLRFMRVDAQSERFLSPPAVGRNAHDLKTCGRLSFCVRTRYDANERHTAFSYM